MPSKNPVVVESGVLKSACASNQTLPSPSAPTPATVPRQLWQFPASTTGSPPAPATSRTQTASAWTTPIEAAISLRASPSQLTRRWSERSPLRVAARAEAPVPPLTSARPRSYGTSTSVGLTRAAP